MNNNSNSNTSAQQQQAGSGPMQQNSGGGNKNLLLVIAAIAIILLVIVVVFLLFATTGPSGATTVAQNHSSNMTAVYMSAAQAQMLLGSQVSNYYASDLFNPSSPVNVSDLEYAVPQLGGNVTSGWISSGAGSGAVYNNSVQYYLLKTDNPSSESQALSSAIVSSLNLTPSVVSPGAFNGLSYTYGVYENSTVSFQIVSGWKGNNIVLLVLESSPPYIANETQFVAVAANDTG